jgi:phosphatidylinositol glycan class V
MQRPRLWRLLWLAIGVRLLTVAGLLLVPRILPAFDPSAAEVLPPNDLYLQGFLRWDTLYFDKIARTGYTREQEFAFMPALPWLMRTSGDVLASCLGHAVTTTGDCLIAASVLANLATVLAVLVFYSCVPPASLPLR